MLEKKRSCTASDGSNQEETLAIIDTESGGNEILASVGERLSPSNRSSSSSNSHRSNIHHKSHIGSSSSNVTADYQNIYQNGKNTVNENSSACGSVTSSSGKRSKSKESYHSSDEVIDEEDLLAISYSEYVDNDNNYPIIPGMITVPNTSDVDSAFEDSHYSGSSDDKTRKGSGKNVIKNKSRRRSSKNSSGSNSRHRRYENIAEIATGNEEDVHGESLTNCNPSGGAQGRGKSRKMECLQGNIETDQDFKQETHQLISRSNYNNPSPDSPPNGLSRHPYEPTLFDLEVSPADGSHEVLPESLVSKPYEQVLSYHRQLSHEPHNYNYPQNHRDSIEFADMESQIHDDDLRNSRSSLEFKDHYTTEEDLDVHGHPTTILLPPLEVRILSDQQDEIELGSPSARRDSTMSQQLGVSDLNFPNANNKISVLIPPMATDLAKNTNISAGDGNFNGEREPIKESGGANAAAEPSEEDEDYQVVYVVPDGGWGWMVLFGSILVNILIPGTVKSFGVLFVEFLEVFNASPVAAAWIPALSYWLYSSMGPFASALAIKFSHRSITIVGGLLASLGLMLSYFATSISYLYISYGIIGGLGAGLAYPIGVFMVGQYFDKRRGLANGLCTSGSALGSVLIPPLLRVLLVEYGYRGAILIMGGILLNVCVGAMFYDPVEKHMKKQLIPREKPPPRTTETEPKIVIQQTPPPPARKITSPISRNVHVPSREVAASMPIAIPMPPQNITDFRDVRDRRGSGSGRRATFQIGHETPQDESWSYKSNEVGSPLISRHGKDDPGVGGAGSPKWSIYNPGVIRVRGHLPYSNESNPEIETLIHSNSSGMMTTPGGTTLSLSAMGTSRGQSRLNLTAIPEDDDTASESASRRVDWSFYSALPPAKQRLLRLSMGGGTQLMGSHGTPTGMVIQTGLSRTLSVASNVSSSSFHYISTIHHGSVLTAMQLDKNVPELASTLTLKSVRDSCCPKWSTLKGICRKLTCGFWPKSEPSDEKDNGSLTIGDQSPLQLEQKPKRHSDRLKKFIDLSLLKDGIYIIMLLSNSTTAVGYTNFIVLLPSYALALGFDKSEAASLLSVVAALDFVGRIGGAALSDLQFISRKWFYIVGLFFSGVALALLPMAKTYSTLVLFCAAFGLASGTYIGVTAVILADQLGAEKLGSSYGISLFFNGLLQLIGPPVCGLLLQHIGRLEPILTGLGITLIFGASLWIFTPFIERNRALKQKLEVIDDEGLERCETTADIQVLPKLNGNLKSETSLV